jgi:hypothetical protein
MTASEFFKKETEDILQRKGNYIPPYRLANLMKTSQKILDTIVKSDICMSYCETLLVLRIVSNAVKEVTGENEE